ncbi:unnamed protein product [Schistosoma margrebowiei]|uniref:Uncharacterized protein n=1 Tax=Schistosoma margrebowiei TaxID=48269 RepID=A0A183LKW8_9TREM|nr:unnamed protein product [Schistosoma margrebowiei]
MSIKEGGGQSGSADYAPLGVTGVREDEQCSNSLSISRSQHTHSENQDSPIQHRCANPIILDGEYFDVAKIITYLSSIIDEHDGSDAETKARICKARAAYLQLKNIWNLKHLSVDQHQSHNFQHKCEDSSTIWSGNSQKYESHHPEDTGVY